MGRSDKEFQLPLFRPAPQAAIPNEIQVYRERHSPGERNRLRG